MKEISDGVTHIKWLIVHQSQGDWKTLVNLVRLWLTTVNRRLMTLRMQRQKPKALDDVNYQGGLELQGKNIIKTSYGKSSGNSNKSEITSFADLMSSRDAKKNKDFFVKDAPDMVFDGTRELEGIHVHYNKLKGVEEVQPWKAYYDDYGRLVARTDYNAGNKAAGIPDVHYHLYEWGKGFADWKHPHEYASHLEGEFTWTTKR